MLLLSNSLAGDPLATAQKSRAGSQLPPALVGVRPPVREFLTVWRVGDLPEVSPIRSRCEDVLLVRARQIQGEDNAFAVGRPGRLERDGMPGARVQWDGVLAGAVRVNDVQPSLAVVGQDPLPIW